MEPKQSPGRWTTQGNTPKNLINFEGYKTTKTSGQLNGHFVVKLGEAG